MGRPDPDGNFACGFSDEIDCQRRPGDRGQALNDTESSPEIFECYQSEHAGNQSEYRQTKYPPRALPMPRPNKRPRVYLRRPVPSTLVGIMLSPLSTSDFGQS